MAIGIPFTNLNPFSFFVVLGQTKSKLNNIKWQANLGGAGIGKSQSINRTGFCDVITRSCPLNGIPQLLEQKQKQRAKNKAPIV